MSTLDRSPLTARCDSSGSEETNDRNTPSPYSMLQSNLGENEPYNQNHEYAKPEDLRGDIAFELEKIDSARKKRNLIYESTAPISNKLDNNRNGILPRPQTDASDEALIPPGTVKGTKRRRTLLCLVIAVFIMSLVAVSLAIFAFLSRDGGGSMMAQKSSTEKPESTSSTGDPILIHDDKVDAEEVHRIKYNLTHLTEHVIKDLEEKIEALNKKLEAKAIEGPRGPEGPAGPPGTGDFSKCTYEEKKTFGSKTVAFTDTRFVADDKNTKIMSVTCSHVGAQAAVLKSNYDSVKGQREYFCRCAGISELPALKSKDPLYISCIIHTWKCPKTT
ncbi:uncharacterized protein [Clytia hemisphaerica]|uniref:Uncharacterized protein n=1 Tax=Clytia hemisphaerica TaxID=252671 RepID=A0A7M5VFV3_9CNID